MTKIAIFGATGTIGTSICTHLITLSSTSELLLVARNAAKAEDIRRELLAIRNIPIKIDIMDLMDSEEVGYWANNRVYDQIFYCAGVGYFHPESPENEMTTWQINYHAPKLLCHTLSKQQSPSRFVYLSSLAATIPHPYLKSYSASKGAFQQYALAFSAELRRLQSPFSLCILVLGPVASRFFPQSTQKKLGGTFLQMSPARAAKTIIKASHCRSDYSIIGLENHFILTCLKFLPLPFVVNCIERYLVRGV